MLATGQTATTDDVATVLAHFSRERTPKRKDAIERAGASPIHWFDTGQTARAIDC